MEPQHSLLETLLEVGLPGQVISGLEESLLSGRGDSVLLSMVHEEALLLLAFLRHASGSQTHPQPRPLDLMGAWRQMGPRRARAYLESLLLLSPLREEHSATHELLGRMRRVGDALMIQCGSPEPAVQTLLRLLELVPVLCTHRGVVLPAWHEWAGMLLHLMERPHLYHNSLIEPLRHLARGPEALDRELGRAAAILALCLRMTLEEASGGMELNQLCRLLDVKPWQLLREGAIDG